MNTQTIAMAYWLQDKSSLPWQQRVNLFRHGLQYDLDFLRAHMCLEELKPIEDEILFAHGQGVRFLLLTDLAFPQAIAILQDPPLVLSYKGNWPGHIQDCLSVVGSRSPCSESLEWLDVHLTQFIRKTKVPIISGGAHGIDRKAHLVSLRQKNTTLNFLPSGILNPYPRNWLFEEKEFLMNQGVFVSEFLPKVAVAKHHFVRRNRLISGIASAVLILDAGIRSGTYLTARIAAEQNVPLFILPGHPMDPRFEGSLRMISEGAAFVRDSTDLLQYFQAECSVPRTGFQNLAARQ